jgi:hypothetical protein
MDPLGRAKFDAALNLVRAQKAMAVVAQLTPQAPQPAEGAQA